MANPNSKIIEGYEGKLENEVLADITYPKGVTRVSVRSGIKDICATKKNKTINRKQKENLLPWKNYD